MCLGKALTGGYLSMAAAICLAFSRTFRVASATAPPLTGRRGRVVYKLTAEGKERFAALLAGSGPETYDDEGFGVHFAFFGSATTETRLRILEGRRSRLEERLDTLRTTLARSRERMDSYTQQLQRHGLESVEREVRWLSEAGVEENAAGFSRDGRWLLCLRNKDSEIRPLLYEVATGARPPGRLGHGP